MYVLHVSCMSVEANQKDEKKNVLLCVRRCSFAYQSETKIECTNWIAFCCASALQNLNRSWVDALSLDTFRVAKFDSGDFFPPPYSS